MPSLVAITRWTTLAAATAVIAGCGDTASTAPAPATKKISQATKTKPEAAKKQPPTDTEQLDTLLADRGAALEQGDAQDFLATSTGAQATKDKRQIARGEGTAADVGQARGQGHRGHGDRATLRVEHVLLVRQASTPTTTRPRA